MSEKLIKVEILMTEDEMKNLTLAVNGDDSGDFRDTWKTETRKVMAAKVLSAVTIARQKLKFKES